MYTAANGTAFTDDDLERWAQEAEAGFPGATFSPYADAARRTFP